MVAPPRAAEPEETPAARTPPTREQVEAAARDVALQLGAPSAEALTCLPARLADAKGWLAVSGPDGAPIWLVIVRGPVALPRPGGRVIRARRTEVAVDAASGRALGFRLIG